MASRQQEEEEPAVVITDKRKINAAGEARPQPVAVPEMSDADRELLRKQAAEYDGIPYEGAGLEAPVETAITNYRTVFQVAVSETGVPTIIRAEIPERFDDDDEGNRVSLGPSFTYDRDPNNRDIWLACTEIAGDINRAETAMVTANALAQEATRGMARQQAQMNAAREAAAAGAGRRTRRN